MGCCETSNKKNIQVNISWEQINKVSKGICKIIIKGTSMNATGFFLDIYPTMKCLLTNNHVISQDMVNANSIIEIENDSGEKIELKLNKNERYIKCFDKPIDITIIQIKNSDMIDKYFQFLLYDTNYKNGYSNYEKQTIFALQHRLGNQLQFGSGIILKNINVGCSFAHDINTDVGSSGSPIILSSNSKVIGIHKSGNIKTKENYATYIGIIFEEINKDFNQQLIIKEPNINLLNKNEKPSKIVAILVVIPEYVNKEILIINSYENYLRNSLFTKMNLQDAKGDERLYNEEQIKQCEIKIDGEKIDFTYSLKFPTSGRHIITYTFKNKLTKCHCLFYNCPHFIVIDLSKFNAENVTDMRLMFYRCTHLVQVNLPKLNTKNLVNISGMFGFCHFIENIDLSYFETSNVTDMSMLFLFCFELKKIKFSSNFDTRNVANMNLMFGGCKSLKNIDVSNFNTQNVKDMSLLFSVCSSLKSLDLSNFNTQNVENMSLMFESCSSLSHLNLLNFNTQNVTNISKMFKGCNSLKKENIVSNDKKILNEYDKKLIYDEE